MTDSAGLPALNDLEQKVLNLLCAASHEFDHEYGVLADIPYHRAGITGKQFAGYVRSLRQKQYIVCHGPQPVAAGIKVRTFILTPACKRLRGIHTGD